MSNVLSDIKWLNDVKIKEKLSSSVRGAGPRLPRSGHLSTIPWVFELWSIPSWQILADRRFSDGATPSKQGAMQLHQLQLDIRWSEFHGCNLWCTCTVWSVQVIAATVWITVRLLWGHDGVAWDYFMIFWVIMRLGYSGVPMVTYGSLGFSWWFSHGLSKSKFRMLHGRFAELTFSFGSIAAANTTGQGPDDVKTKVVARYN